MKRAKASITAQVQDLDFKGLTASQISRQVNIPLKDVLDITRPNTVAKSRNSYAYTLRGYRL